MDFLKQNWAVIFAIAFVLILAVGSQNYVLEIGGTRTIKEQIIEQPIHLVFILWPIPFMVLIFISTKQMMRWNWFGNLNDKMFNSRLCKLIFKASFLSDKTNKTTVSLILSYLFIVVFIQPFIFLSKILNI
jgi:hypothetical protein